MNHRFSAVRVLAAKDFRLLRPLILGLLILQLLSDFSEFVLQPLDESTILDRDSSDPVVALVMVVMPFCVAFIAALVLFPGERETGSDQFVATLPVSQRTALLTKVLVIIVVMLGSTWLTTASETAQALSNPDSVTRRQLTAQRWFLDLGLAMAVALFASLHAVWLAWLGRMGWVVLTAATMMSAWLPKLDPALARLRLDGLVALEHHGTQPLLPWQTLAFHSVLALLGLAMGVRLWARDREGAVHRLFPRLRKLTRALAFAAGGVLVFAAVLALAVRPFNFNGSHDESSDPSAGAAPTLRKTTQHFTFTYRPDDEAQAAALVRGAEGAYERVQAWAATPGPPQIIVDLTYQGVDLGGLAVGARISIDVTTRKGRDHLQAVFVHELVHVFHHHIVGTARASQGASLRFLSEGLAEHVTFAVLGRGEAQEQSRRRAAWAHLRYRITLADLLNAPAFVNRYDERWLYDFGELYTAAIASVCGRAAPLRLFRQLGDGTVPLGLRGEPLLRHLLGEGGCSLERVGAWVGEQLRAYQSKLGSLPLVRARFQQSRGTDFVFDIQPVAPPNAVADSPVARDGFLMLRRDGASSPRDYAGQSLDLVIGQTTRTSIEAPALEGDRFQYRVGLQPPWGGGHFFTRWRTTTNR